MIAFCPTLRPSNYLQGLSLSCHQHVHKKIPATSPLVLTSRPVVVRPQCSSTSPLITRPLHSRCQSRQSLELMSSASLPSTSENSGVHTTETHPSCSGVPIRQNPQPQPELSIIPESVLVTPQQNTQHVVLELPLPGFPCS